jgi:hypothetical protein
VIHSQLVSGIDNNVYIPFRRGRRWRGVTGELERIFAIRDVTPSDVSRAISATLAEMRIEMVSQGAE